MDYQTPELPEGLNAPERQPLLAFIRLFVMITLVVAGLSVVLWWSAAWLARQTPFAWEQAVVGDQVLGPFQVESGGPRSAALQRLADRLAAVMALPEDMQVRVHYSNDEVANAYATLGGHVVVTRGLLEAVDSENGLAMVLAHEIAHIRHRDPIGSLGGSLALSVLIGALVGSEVDLSGYGAHLTQLSFSRAQERAADRAALAALQSLYGHVHGADELFARLLYEPPSLDALTPSFLSTHPHARQRLQVIRNMQAEDEAVALAPLPAELNLTTNSAESASR